MLFVSISFALGNQRERNFLVDYGLYCRQKGTYLVRLLGKIGKIPLVTEFHDSLTAVAVGTRSIWFVFYVL